MSNPLRKTMVYLGLADDDYNEPTAPAPTVPAAANAHPAQNQTKAPVTPLRRNSSKPQPVGDMNEIYTIHPREYRDAQAIAESFRDGTPVIINLSQMSDADARRLIDFASGLSSGLYGRIERVTSKVFLLSPSHVSISGETADADSEVEAGFFQR